MELMQEPHGRAELAPPKGRAALSSAVTRCTPPSPPSRRLLLAVGCEEAKRPHPGLAPPHPPRPCAAPAPPPGRGGRPLKAPLDPPAPPARRPRRSAARAGFIPATVVPVLAVRSGAAAPGAGEPSLPSSRRPPAPHPYTSHLRASAPGTPQDRAD